MALDFFQASLEKLGAICERSWHDRLHLVAEGAAARLWKDDESIVDAEISFSPPEGTISRDAAREVYPGCPLTFRLSETLLKGALQLERLCIEPPASQKLGNDIAEKLWRAQFSGTTHWKMETPFRLDWHFSLMALVRCEIQAIDQHWSLHRMVLSLPDGDSDNALAENLDFFTTPPAASKTIPWPVPNVGFWHQALRQALEAELAEDLSSIRQRQQLYLNRELKRVDQYFEDYAGELRQRQKRSSQAATRQKMEDRLSASYVEHQKRRRDQIQRHEICVIPHMDALLLLAEPAWESRIAWTQGRDIKSQSAHLIPRCRRWAMSHNGP